MDLSRCLWKRNCDRRRLTTLARMIVLAPVSGMEPRGPLETQPCHGTNINGCPNAPATLGTELPPDSGHMAMTCKRAMSKKQMHESVYTSGRRNTMGHSGADVRHEKTIARIRLQTVAQKMQSAFGARSCDKPQAKMLA